MPTRSFESIIDDINNDSIHHNEADTYCRREGVCRLQALKGSASEPLNGESYSGVVIPIHNQKTGEIDTAQIFVAVLGASGYTYADASLSQKQEDFIYSHVSAYRFFGGVPEVVVPDNLKSAVISNNKNGIVINESYAALARYYSMRVEPARPYKPKDQP